MTDNNLTAAPQDQASMLNCFSAEILLEGSPVLEQVIAIRDALCKGSDGTVVDYYDMLSRIENEVGELPALELQMSVPPGSEGAYQRQLLQALDQINGDHDRVLRKVLKLKSRLLEAVSLLNNKRAQFAAYYAMAIPIGIHLTTINKLKITAAGAKEMAAAEFSKLVDRMDDHAPSIISELGILEAEIKQRKKTQADKYQLGKDQVNAMWDSIQSTGAVGLDEDPNSLLRKIEVEYYDEIPSFVSKHSKEARILASPSHITPLNTRCSMCGEKQFSTPSGATCSNGHGGAPPVDDIKGTFFKRGDAKPLNVIIRDDGEVETVVELPAEEEPVLIQRPTISIEEVIALRADADECITDPADVYEGDYEAVWDKIPNTPPSTTSELSTPAPTTPRKKLILDDDEEIS